MKDELFIKLYNEKGPIIYKYLIKNGANHELAQDIVQNTFIKVMEYMGDIEIKNIYSWMFRVAINQYYDYCRKKLRYPEVDIDSKEFFCNLVLEDDCQLELIRSENAKEIKKVLNSLKDTYKSLLVLKYELKLSYKEISIALNLSESNVRTGLARARNQFKKAWEGNINE